MNIAEITESFVTLSSEYKGHKYQVEVYDNALSPQIMQCFQDVKEKPIEFATALSKIIKGWDIDMNGEPFPPNFENLSKCPADFLGHILELVSENWQGKSQTSEQSASGSAAKAK